MKQKQRGKGALINWLITIPPLRLLWLSVASSILFTQVIVIPMSLFFHGKVTHDLLITGIICAFFVSLIICYLLVRLIDHIRESERQYRHIFENVQDVFYQTDEKGILINVSPSVLKYSGYAREELIGRPAELFYADPQDRRKLVEEIQKKGQVVDYDVRMKSRDNRHVSVSINAHLLYDSKGRPAGIEGSLRDVTARKRTETALRENERYLRAVIETEPECIKLLDADGVLLQMNRAGLAMIDADSLDQVRGLCIYKSVVPEHREAFQSLTEDVFKGKSGILEFEAIGLKGRRIWLDSHAVPLRNDNNEIIALLAITRDITERKRIENELIQAKEEWERTFNSMTDLIMILDTKHKVVRTNKAMSDKLKMTPSEAVGIACYEHVHGLSAPPAFCPHALLLSDGREHSAEVYEERLGGHYLVTVTPLFDTKGGVVGAVHTAKDITERKRMERLLQESESRLRNITEVIGEGIYVVDAHGRVTFMNPEAEKILGWTEAELLGREMHEVIHFQKADKTPLPVAECPVLRTITSGETFRDEEDVFTRKDGSMFPVSIVATALREDGRIVGAVAAFQDITERKKTDAEMKLLNEILARQATTDPLTGISNRLKFNDLLGTEIRRSKRFNTPLSLIMFDIDHFKKINDTFGHHAGDEVLRELTGLVAQNIRSHDLFARWGGEEFMIMVTNTAAENARLYAEKLRLLIENREFPKVLQVTCSFGVAQLAGDDDDDRFTRRVDDALYQAKARGRNRVEMA